MSQNCDFFSGRISTRDRVSEPCALLILYLLAPRGSSGIIVANDCDEFPLVNKEYRKKVYICC